MTDRDDWANGVLLRAIALPQEPPKVAAGPGLLARRFGIDLSHNAQPVAEDTGLWLSEASGPPGVLVESARVGIRQGLDLPWRWLWAGHPSLSKPVVPLQPRSD